MTGKEIIEDFRFVVEDLWGEKKRGKHVIVDQDPSKIMVKFTGG